MILLYSTMNHPAKLLIHSYTSRQNLPAHIGGFLDPKRITSTSVLKLVKAVVLSSTKGLFTFGTRDLGFLTTECTQTHDGLLWS